METPSNAEPRTLGDVVRTARETLRYSQQELADLCHVSLAYVCQLEKNERVPSVPVCHSLAQALNDDVRRLYVLDYRAITPLDIQEAAEGG